MSGIHCQPQPNAKPMAAQTSVSPSPRRTATLCPRLSLGTVTILCRLRTTSVGTPRIAGLTGAIVTVEVPDRTIPSQHQDWPSLIGRSVPIKLFVRKACTASRPVYISPVISTTSPTLSARTVSSVSGGVHTISRPVSGEPSRHHLHHLHSPLLSPAADRQ